MGTVQQITGQATTPKTFAGVLVARADEIEHIACVIKWKSGDTTVNYVQMTLGDAAWLSYVFLRDFMANMETDGG
jgi:hypothetical protein